MTSVQVTHGGAHIIALNTLTELRYCNHLQSSVNICMMKTQELFSSHVYSKHLQFVGYDWMKLDKTGWQNYRHHFLIFHELLNFSAKGYVNENVRDNNNKKKALLDLGVSQAPPPQWGSLLDLLE